MSNNETYKSELAEEINPTLTLIPVPVHDDDDKDKLLQEACQTYAVAA